MITTMTSLNWRMIIVLAILTTVSLLFLWNRSRKKMDDKNDGRSIKDLNKINRYVLGSFVRSVSAEDQTIQKKMMLVQDFLRWQQIEDHRFSDWWNDYFRQFVKHAVVMQTYNNTREYPRLAEKEETMVTIDDFSVVIYNLEVINYPLLDAQKPRVDFLLFFLCLPLVDRPDNFRGAVQRLQRLIYLFFQTLPPIDTNRFKNQREVVEEKERAADNHWKALVEFVETKTDFNRTFHYEGHPLLRHEPMEVVEFLHRLRIMKSGRTNVWQLDE